MITKQDKRASRLGEDRIGRLLWAFSLPAIAGMMVGSLYTIIDRAFLGNVVGADALSGVSVTMPIGFIIIAFGMLFGVGSSTQVSIRLGQKRKEDAELVLGNTVTLILGASLLLTVILLLGLDSLLGIFGVSASTRPFARQFMQELLRS